MHSNTDVRAGESAGSLATGVWLSRHVHVCRLDSVVVVLDLAKDRYFGLQGAVEQALATAVPGWPQPATGEVATRGFALTAGTAQIVTRFLAEGLLTQHEADGKPAAPPMLDLKAARIAMDTNVPRDCVIRFADVLAFLTACVSTAWSLRFQSLQRAIEVIAARKRSRVQECIFDAEQAADLVAIFRRLRSFTFAGHRRCLFHALTLMNFLSRYGVFPDFVMGVKLEPWGAHAWVQCGEYVLDGTPEQVRFYTPIFVV